MSFEDVKCQFRGVLHPEYCQIHRGTSDEGFFGFFCPIKEDKCCYVCDYKLRCPSLCRICNKKDSVTDK